MYLDVVADSDLAQGHIVDNVVFGYLPISNPALYNVDGDRVDFDPRQHLRLQDRIDAMVAAQKSKVAILSQDCDCLSKPYISIARIVPLLTFDRNYADLDASRRTTVKKRAEYIENLYQRPGGKPDAFYLQENPALDLPKSVISFLELHSIETTEANIAYLKQQRIGRLNQEAVFDLQFRLAFYYGRFATTAGYMLTADEKASLTRREAEIDIAQAPQPAAPPQQ